MYIVVPAGDKQQNERRNNAVKDEPRVDFSPRDDGQQLLPADVALGRSDLDEAWCSKYTASRWSIMRIVKASQ